MITWNYGRKLNHSMILASEGIVSTRDGLSSSFWSDGHIEL
jgi:hypothetical protein